MTNKYFNYFIHRYFYAFIYLVASFTITSTYIHYFYFKL